MKKPIQLKDGSFLLEKGVKHMFHRNKKNELVPVYKKKRQSFAFIAETFYIFKVWEIITPISEEDFIRLKYENEFSKKMEDLIE